MTMFSVDQLNKMQLTHQYVVKELESLMLKGLAESGPLQSEIARRHLTHGVGRRISVMKRSIQQIFVLFPPTQEIPIPRDVLADVQIYLHAFVTNLSGVFDNWAWAFLYRYNLDKEIKRLDVSLFKERTQRLLPTIMREYLSAPDMAKWHDDYLKNYRDALAHRIPLYVPPANWSQEDNLKYQELEQEKINCINQSEWERLDNVWAQQDVIGRACPLFLHEFTEKENPTPIQLHPQILADGSTVIEFGKMFYATWNRHETTF